MNYFKIATDNKQLTKDEQLALWYDYKDLVNLMTLNGLPIHNKSISLLVNMSDSGQARQIKKFIRSRDRLVFSNMAMIIKEAKKLDNDSYALEEMIQIGCTGLLYGMSKFDPKANTKPSSYFYFWIVSAMKSAIYRSKMVYTPPVYEKDYKYKFSSIDALESFDVEAEDNVSSINQFLVTLSKEEQETIDSSFDRRGDLVPMALALELGITIDDAQDRISKIFDKARQD